MQPFTIKIIIILSILLLSYSQVGSQTRDRSQVPEKYRWDLSHLYASDEAWAEAKKRANDHIDKISSFKGTLSESAGKLLSCLEFTTEIDKALERLGNYAYNKSGQDMRDAKYQAMNREINQLNATYAAAGSFIEPEILAIGEATIRRFIASEPGLGPYTFYLNDLIRRKPHILSGGEEKIIAEAGRISATPVDLYNTFVNVEFPYPRVTLGSGETVELDPAGYRRYRNLPDPEDRELVIKTFLKTLNRYRHTFGALLNAKVNSDLFYSRVLGYRHCLDMILDPDHIPETVYHNLIADANRNLDKFHRFLKIKQRLLGVDTLNYSDLFAPAVLGVHQDYDVEEARKLILESLKPLGPDYTTFAKKAFGNRWIDFFPTPGKRFGAYNNDGAYDAHPYILLNYTCGYDDLAILAGELGHSVHTCFANRTQPFPTAGYSSFTAETASHVNEVLLRETMLKKIRDDHLRLYLLLAANESSIFDRARVSEFELKIHQEVESGRTLTGDSISTIYLDTLRKYYGHHPGVCIVPDYFSMSWCIDHLLIVRTYRIYLYGASQIAATALAQKVLAGEKGAVTKYLALLSAGGSDYPIDILKNAGVDMTSPQPFQQTMEAMGRTMDTIEGILDKKGI